MMRHIVFLMFFTALLTGSARAMLPPDAKAREPQLRAYRQKLNDNYEKKLVERQALAVRAYEQTRADIFTPPWMRTEVKIDVLSETERLSAMKTFEAQKRNHRLLVSAVLLILIGAAAVWVRHITREIDE